MSNYLINSDAYPEQVLAATRDELRHLEWLEAARAARRERRQARRAAVRERLVGWMRG